MLKKIIAIKNVGRFRNSAASGNPQLLKYTFIVGANGYGKTTVCAVLRSLQTGDAAHVLGRKTLGATDTPTVELLLDPAATRFDGAAWSATHPHIAIFDGTFVSENVHSGDVVEIDQKRNLYRIIIGDQGVTLAEQDATLAAESRAKTGEITAAARSIQPHVPTGMTVEAFTALPAAADIDAQIADQEQTIAAIRQSATISARAPLTEIPALALDDGFEALLSKTVDVAQDAETLLADHLADHGMEADGGNWIADGMRHAKGDACPFCGQDVRGLPLIAAYRAVFSDRYNALKEEIAGAQVRVHQLLGDAALARFGVLAEQNRGGIDFWARYCTFDAAPLAVPADLGDAARELGAAALELLEQKARAPLDAIAVTDRFTSALEGHRQAQAQATSATLAIRAVNSLIAAKKAETAGADLRQAETELARRKAIKTRHTDAVGALCLDHERLTTEKADIETRKESIRGRLDAHTRAVVRPYELRINAFLSAFNAGFTIAETKHTYPGGVATSSYQLVINDTQVDVGDGRTPSTRPSFKNTLSAGDRTTLALAFFLAYAERDPALAQKIIVFDDPFNSQDAFRRRQTAHEIMRLAGQCAQVIVLSHDATFLKQL